ncbi:MAG: OmpA family protein [Amphritea sp.]|nr:OmpA family protein [Amphritea sp.]
MNIKNKIIFIGLLGLLSTSVFMAGCAHYKGDPVALSEPAEVIVGEGSGVYATIEVPAASMFAFDSAELNDSGKAVIEEYRSSFGSELTDSYLVLVVGHTDTSGDASYNDTLSLNRAQSVADYLVSTGTKEEAIRVIGRGSREPIASNDTLEGRIQNRRVDILLVAEVRAMDTLLFPSLALFDPKSAKLTDQGQAFLEEQRLNSKALFDSAFYVEIVGHADSKGSAEDNIVLSEQRANTVRDYLVSKGLDASIVETKGMGDTMPIADNDTAEGRAKNRRVEILVLGRLKE